MPRDPATPSWFTLESVADAPDVPGLYAWYYRPYISQGDIKGLGDGWTADDLAGLIRRRFFTPLREMAYDVSLSGPLRPTLSGTLSENYQSHVDRVVARVSEEGVDLASLGTSLELLSEACFAPLYVGISKTSLRTRLGQHKNLINTALERRVPAPATPESPTADDEKRKREMDKAFAHEVVERDFTLDRMSVAVHALDVSSAGITTIEYILNRISFPLLGRR